MSEELEARVALLEAEKTVLLREIARLSEELQQAREDVNAAEARGYLLSQSH